MQTPTTTSARPLTSDGVPRVVERSRATAHETGPTTRDRVARSLLLRPEARDERDARR